jgi:hypothetical protein
METRFPFLARKPSKFVDVAASMKVTSIRSGIANAIMQGILSATFLRIDRIRSCKSEFCVIERHIAIALGPIRYF